MNISIIIPAYQCKAVIAETVENVLNSEMPLAEILLVDDGSTDGTAGLCDHFAQQNPLIRCIHKENGGVSSARNLGIEEAKGDYIWFVDSDDAICPIPESELTECEKANPGMILFGMEFDYYRGNRLMRTEIQQMPEKKHLAKDQYGQYFKKLFYTNYLSPVWNKLFDRKLLLEHGIRFDQALTNYEDLAFSLEVMGSSNTISILPDVCYVYKTDYDHDRTVDRIAKIDNVAANTDLIAKAFFSVAEKCGFDNESAKQLERIVLMVYLDLFRVKIQTTPLWSVRKQCEDFSASSYFAHCERTTSSLSSGAQKLLYRIHKKRPLSIWLQIRYRKARSRAVKLIKPLLGKA